MKRRMWKSDLYGTAVRSADVRLRHRFLFFFARRVVGSVNKPYKPDSISESAGRAQILTVYVVDVEWGASWASDDRVSMIGVTGGSRVFHFLERRFSAHPVPHLVLPRTLHTWCSRPARKGRRARAGLGWLACGEMQLLNVIPFL